LPPNQGNLGIQGKSEYFIFNQGQSGERKIFQKPKENQVMKLCNVTFQSDDFLDTPEHIQLSVTITEFYLFQYHCALCSPFEVQLFIL